MFLRTGKSIIPIKILKRLSLYTTATFFKKKGAEMSDPSRKQGYKREYFKGIPIGGKRIDGRFVIPSGIRCTNAKTIEYYFNFIDSIGIITTKSISLLPRAGYKEPLYAKYFDNSYINAVGLANPGAEKFADELSKIKVPSNKFILVSIFGQNAEEFLEAARVLERYADGFELNMSCPHAKGYGIQIGHDINLVAGITKQVSEAVSLPVFVKLSATITDLSNTALIAVQNGAAGITTTNTIGPSIEFLSGKPVLSNVVGGLSGEGIRPLGLRSVYEVRQIIGPEAIIIGMGGISNGEDIKNYSSAGADFFGIGSALTNLTTQEAQLYLNTLEEGLISKPHEDEKSEDKLSAKPHEVVKTEGELSAKPHEVMKSEEELSAKANKVQKSEEEVTVQAHETKKLEAELIAGPQETKKDELLATPHFIRQTAKQNDNMDYKRCFVKSNLALTKELHKISMSEWEDCEDIEDTAGQFFFIMLPEIGEKPFAVFSLEERAFIVKNVGNFTEKLTGLNVGDEVFIRGPYGKKLPEYSGYSINFVAGGSGLSPLYEIARNYSKYNKITFFLGGKTAGDIFDQDKYDRLGETNIATEDGSIGLKGYVTEILKNYNFDSSEKQLFINCGPEQMIQKCYEIQRNIAPERDIIVSIEYYTSCGVGICGKCSTESGLLSCVDGPFFHINEALQIKECRHL
jgi:dihydroorotate dehydrogenase subfamily 1